MWRPDPIFITASLKNFPPDSLDISFPAADEFPEILFPREGQASSVSRDTVLLPVAQPLVKRILSAYVDRGLLAALVEARQTDSRLVFSVASKLLSIGSWIYSFWSTEPTEHTMQLVAHHTQTRNWRHSVIRALAWHPHCFKLAVATADDLICIYAPGAAVTPVLTAELQKSITCLAWRPCASGELAVGCQNGVLIWSVDPNTQIARPLSKPLRLQYGTRQWPISAISWSRNGDQLAMVSICDSSVYVWRVDRQQQVRLPHPDPPCAMVDFGPTGANLLISTVGQHFYLNENSKRIYKPSVWCTARGSLQSFAWSRDECHLLYVTSEDMELFHMLVDRKSQHFGLTYSSVDLNRCELEGGHTVGGLPQSIAWCPRDRFLAVSFKETTIIALFITKIDAVKMCIDPYCFVTGIGQCYPCCMQFKLNFHGVSSNDATKSVLTVGWSSGAIAYYQLV